MQCSVASAHVIEPDKRVCERKIPDVIFGLFLQRHEAHVHKETLVLQDSCGDCGAAAGEGALDCIGRQHLVLHDWQDGIVDEV